MTVNSPGTAILVAALPRRRILAATTPMGEHGVTHEDKSDSQQKQPDIFHLFISQQHGRGRWQPSGSFTLKRYSSLKYNALEPHASHSR